MYAIYELCVHVGGGGEDKGGKSPKLKTKEVCTCRYVCIYSNYSQGIIELLNCVHFYALSLCNRLFFYVFL